MKKTVTAVCALACAVFLCACAAGQGERTESAASTDGQAADVQDGGTNENGQGQDCYGK